MPKFLRVLVALTESSMKRSIPVSGFSLCLGCRHMSGQGQDVTNRRPCTKLTLLTMRPGNAVHAVLPCAPLSSSEWVSFHGTTQTLKPRLLSWARLACLSTLPMHVLILALHEAGTQAGASLSLYTKGGNRTDMAKDSFLHLYQDWKQHSIGVQLPI